MTTSNVGALQWSFMYASVLALLLLPVVNHATYLHNLIHTTTDEEERRLLYTRLQRLRYSLFSMSVAILLVIAFIPFHYRYPNTTWAFSVYVLVSAMVITSMMVFVADISRSTYTPKPSS